MAERRELGFSKTLSVILSVSLGECWEPPPEVIQDITKIFNKILGGAP